MIKLKKEATVLFIGDSITHGGRGLSMDLNHIFGHGFQEMVCSRLAADNYENMPKFINKGISGDTSHGIYSRWSEDVIRYKPTMINLLAGVNDIGHSMELPPEMTTRKYFDALEGMIKDTRELLGDIPFFVCEPFFLDVLNQDAPFENIPHPLCEVEFKYHNSVRLEEVIKRRKDAISLIQKELPAFCEKYGVIFVPFQDMFDEVSKSTPASYFVWDNVHPTMVGHRLMADRWFSVAEKAIGEGK